MKSISTFLFSILSLTLLGQEIPNPGFENWTSNTWNYTPDGWMTENSQLWEPVDRDFDAYEGDYAMRVTSQPTGVGEYASASALFEIDYIPSNLTFYVKTLCEFGAVQVTIYFYEQEAIVAYYDWFTSETMEDWTQITIEMDGIDPIITDAEIIVSAQVGDLVAGDAIISVDAMEFDAVTSTFDPNVSDLSIYPNPTVDHFTIGGDHQVESLRIYNALGVLVMESSINELNRRVDVSELPNGTYVVSAEDREGNRYVEKLIVSK